MLRGKRVAISGRGSNSEFYLDTCLATAGMVQDEIKLVLLPQQEALAALLSGGIDAMFANEHLEISLDKKFPEKVVRGIGLSDVISGFQYADVAFGPSMLERDPEIGVQLLTACLQGAKDFLAGKAPGFLDEVARETGRDPDSLKRLCREMYVPEGDIDQQYLEFYHDWATRKGYSPEEIPIADLVDASYLKETRERSEATQSL